MKLLYTQYAITMLYIMFDQLLSYIEKDQNISDILISESGKLAMRVSGVIHISDQIVDASQFDQIISEICNQNKIVWESSEELDV